MPWVARLFEVPRIAFQLMVAALVAALLFHGPRVGEALRQAGEDAGPRHRALPYLVAHLAALATYTWLTAHVLSGSPKSDLASLAWSSAWAALALLVVLTWLAIGIPPSRWLPLLRRGPGLLLLLATLGLAAWGAGQACTALWLPLGRSTLAFVHSLLQIVFSTTTYEPKTFTIGSSNFVVTIAPVCSGFEGMGLIAVLTAAYLWTARDRLRFPHALALLPIGVAVMWVANAFRIAILIVLGSFVSGKLALESFHSQAGWLAFNLVGLGVVSASRHWTFFRRGDAENELGEGLHPSAPYLVPILVLLALGMVSAAVTTGFDRLYPIRILAVAAALWAYRARYTELRLALSWRAVAIGVAVFVLWMALEPLARSTATSTNASARMAERPDGPWFLVWLLFRVVGSVIVVSLAEELAFRGYLTRRLISADFESLPIGTFSWSSFLASSALFGLLHHDRWIAGTLAGMAYASALYRRRQLTDAFVAHATTNALIAAYVLSSGDWSPWN
jgi:exosortase E/protease (VPEID-CTERM system)